MGVSSGSRPLRGSEMPLPSPGVVVRSVAALSYVAAALPVALVLLVDAGGAPWTTAPTASGWPSGVAVAGGLLLLLQLWLSSWSLRRHNRTIRASVQARRLGGLLLTIVVTASPIGDLLTTQWQAHPVLYRYGGVVPAAISLLAWAAQAQAPRLARVRGGGLIRGAGLLFRVIRAVLLRGGLLAFFLAAVFQARAGLVFAATALVAAETLPNLWGWIVGGFGAIWVLDITVLLRLPPAAREIALQQWAYDAIATPRRPDDSLLRTLVTLAVTGVAGEPAKLLPTSVKITLPRGGTGVQPLLSLAEAGLAIIEYAVLPGVDGARRTAIEQRVEAIRAYVCTARAHAAFQSGRIDEALAEIRENTRRLESMGYRNLAALNMLSSGFVGLPGDTAGRADTMRIAADPSLSAAVRRLALYSAALQASRAEEPEAARRLYDEARRQPVGRAGRAGLLREVRSERGQGQWLPSWRMRLELKTGRLFERYLADSVREQIEGVPVVSRMGPSAALQETLETGRLAARAGRAGDAVALLSRAAEEAERFGHAYTLIDASYWLAVAQADTDPAGAYKNLHRAVDVYDLFRGGIVDDRYRADVGGALTMVHLEAMRLLVAHAGLRADGWPAQPALAAFELAERARSRQMLELLSTAAPPPADGPPELLDEEQAAMETCELAVRAVMEAAAGDRVRALARLRRARARLDEIWRELARSGPGAAEYTQLRGGRPGSYESIRTSLEAPPGQERREVLFEYHMTGDGDMVLFVARADLPDPRLVPLPVAHAEIRRAVQGMLRTDAQVIDLSALDTLLRPFLEPILEWADESDIVYLVPFGDMHRVPMHALTVDGRPLIDRNPVCYVQSASVLQHCRAKRTGGRREALLLADSRVDRPLPHARVQAAEIARLFGAGHAAVRIGAAATGRELRRALSADAGVDILHLACHGAFSADHVVDSGILLAWTPGEGDPGGSGPGSRLTVNDLMDLRLRADLVTLSACETGISEHQAGDELIGLTRAAIYAGSASVVVSLWSVDEISTSVLMQRFYQRLLGGASKADALRDAQRQVRAMTVTEVIAYCSEARQHLAGPDAPGGRWLLGRDIAEARFRARDFAAALRDYSQLAEELSADPAASTLLPGGANAAIADLGIAQARCRRALRRQVPADYEVQPFAQPYYWAPFVLVGDWR